MLRLDGGGGRGAALLLWVVVWLLAGILPAQALVADRPIRQFTHVWYENQLPQGTVLSIAEQGNGAIWLATYGGLVRHSGEGFDTFDQRIAPALKSSAITAVAADGQQGLWVGTLNGGLYRFADNQLTPVALPGDAGSVFGIVTDSEGALWLTTNLGVMRMRNGHVQLLGNADGFPPRGFYRALVADPSGGVWIAADGVGVVHWQRGKARLYSQDHGLPSEAVYSLSVDPAGMVWVGTQNGPAYFANGRFRRSPALAALDDKRIYTLYADRAGTVWFAPLGMGLCRLVGAALECDNTLPGMGGETVRAMLEDQEGNFWVGTTSSGLQRLSQSKLISLLVPGPSNAVRAVHQVPGGPLWVGTDGGGLSRYNAPGLELAPALNQQLPSLLVRSIQSDASGQLWVAGTEGVTRFDVGGRARTFGLADGMPGTIVFAFAPAGRGGMWAGTLQGVARIDGEQVHVLDATRGDDIRALHEDAEGRLWIGQRSGLRCFHRGVLDSCGTDGLPGTSVFAFLPGSEGELWLGTSEGIARVHGGKVSRFAQNAGFYGDAVFALFDDGRGNFWFSSNRGIGRIARAGLQALAAGTGTGSGVAPHWYGLVDGMLSAQGNGASQAPAARSEDGRLWFGTAKGVVVVDPARIQGNARIPPVAIERMLVDGHEVALQAVDRLGPAVERLEFHFAAMSYVAPAAVQYRYRLEGFDRQWREAGSNRKAYYTNVPPGSYVFRVMASNNDGVWNEQGAAQSFTLLPQWYQTWWMRGLMLLAGVGLLAGGVWLRLRRGQQRERLLTEEVGRRTEALHQANAQLERLASQDALTGIANRRAFTTALLQAWQEQAANAGTLSVLLVDVDDFKAYNDSHGHLAGDAALARVAAVLAAQGDAAGCVVARYGGEEFALLLPGCDRPAAVALAGRAVAAVQACRLPHRASRVAGVVTVSIGVACARPAAGGSPEALLHAADKALYRAKDAGRNRAVAGD